jgi:hypothetical protein
MKMQFGRLVTITFTGFLMLCLMGCASIVDGRGRKISVRSEPSDAKVTVFNSKGTELNSQQTPATFLLERSTGYFSGANYRLVIEKPGYVPTEVALKSTIDGWYFGNIIFGGVIGLLIIDPATGAMWTLSPRDVDVALKQHVTNIRAEKGGVVVILRRDVPDELVARLVTVSN